MLLSEVKDRPEVVFSSHDARLSDVISQVKSEVEKKRYPLTESREFLRGYKSSREFIFRLSANVLEGAQRDLNGDAIHELVVRTVAEWFFLDGVFLTPSFDLSLKEREARLHVLSEPKKHGYLWESTVRLALYHFVDALPERDFSFADYGTALIEYVPNPQEALLWVYRCFFVAWMKERERFVRVFPRYAKWFKEDTAPSATALLPLSPPEAAEYFLSEGDPLRRFLLSRVAPVK